MERRQLNEIDFPADARITLRQSNLLPPPLNVLSLGHGRFQHFRVPT
jgi:hypothetical protein